MKAIQNCLQKIVIYKIYSLEKQKMEYNDNEVYNHIGVGFLIVFSYIVIMTLSKILCKWKQDSVVSFFLYLDSVFKNKHKLVHNQPPV